MKSHAGLVLTILVSAIACGTTFMLALYRQLALVEVTASMATMAELYMLSSSIGDLIEKKAEPNRERRLIGVGLALAVVAYFLIAKALHP